MAQLRAQNRVELGPRSVVLTNLRVVELTGFKQVNRRLAARIKDDLDDSGAARRPNTRRSLPGSRSYPSSRWACRRRTQPGWRRLAPLNDSNIECGTTASDGDDVTLTK